MKKKLLLFALLPLMMSSLTGCQKKAKWNIGIVQFGPIPALTKATKGFKKAVSAGLGKENVNAVDFTSGSILTQQPSDYYAADVRCVSGGSSACAGNPCTSVENATGICFTVTDPESETGYVCVCDEDYSWNGTECAQVAEL